MEPEPEHVHPHQEVRCEMVSGMLRFWVAGAEGPSDPRRAADSAECPPLLSERRGQEAHTIQEFRPALNIEDFFVKYFALARDGQPNGQEMPNLLQLAVLMQAHDDEIRVTRPPRIILYE